MVDMRVLYLLRHAKSAWDDPSIEDHDRPLAARGRRAARAMARHFRGLGSDPELILCSSSERTRETLDLLMPGFAAAPIVAVERGLYLAGAEAMLARLRAVEDRVERVLLIGHNPGLHELALLLAQTGRAKLRAPLARKFPTAALASYAIESGWSAIGPETARLVAYVTPAELGVD
jgi:phosphohistidine phosphatase